MDDGTGPSSPDPFSPSWEKGNRPRRELPARRIGKGDGGEGPVPSSLIFTVEHGIATLTLNRPERMNAIDGGMRHALREAWRRVEEDPEIKVAILTGAGERAFCTGADVRKQAERHQRRDPTREPVGPSGITPRQAGVTKPTICAVNGLCAGGALQFVSDCDLVIASENASFLNPGVSLGLLAPYGPVVLLRRMPGEPVFRLMFVGNKERLTARRAYQLGLVGAVVPPERLLAEARVLAAAIVAQDTEALRAGKREIWEALAGWPRPAGFQAR